MILKTLIIKDMFAYSGIINLNLSPNNNKNIILIGARNGRGKTSFLRIIRILLHGIKDNKDFTDSDAKLSPREYALGKANKWEGIFSKYGNTKKASIYAIFELDEKELIIHRTFKKTSSGFDELLEVELNKKEILGQGQAFIDNILPKNFAQFFFFDGEKLENLMNTQTLKVKDSLEVLLDIKTYDKLIDNLKAILKDYKKNTEHSPTSEQIEHLENEKNSLNSNIKIGQKKIEQIEKEIIILKVDIEEKQDKLTNLLASKKADIRPLKDEKEQIEKELKELREYISQKIKGIDFLVLMVEDLSRNYLTELEDDKTNYQLDEQLKYFKRTLNSMIPKIQNNVFDPDIDYIPPEYNLNSDTTEFYQERIKKVADKIWNEYKNSKSKEIDKQIIYYKEEDKEILNNIFENKNSIYDKFLDLQNLDKRLRAIKNQLDDATEHISENDFYENKYKQDKEELENKKSSCEVEIGKFKRDNELHIKRRDNLDVKIRKLEKDLNLAKPILNSIDLNNDLINFFQEYKTKLLQQKIENLETEFNNHLYELAHDKNWIKEVNINDKFEIKLLNFFEQEMPINSLSAGQKQILATALIQALGSVSQVKSFICIDTPLARIDLENREQIITKYYPKASKQVIILSTNSEINPSKTEYKHMKDFIAKEYTIISTDYKSSFENGYFKEIERK